MAKKSYEVEIMRKVFENDCGHSITVRPSPDFPENVLIYTDSEEDIDYFGKVRLDLPWQMIEMLGQSLIAAAAERKAAVEAA